MRQLVVCLLILAATNSARAQDEPSISIRMLPSYIVQDQKEIWSFPLKLTRGFRWKPMVGFLSTTAALVELDPHDAPYFRRTRTFEDFDKTFSSANTGLSEGLFPVGFYLMGLARRDSYAEKSGLRSIEALADAEAISEVIKNVSRRTRWRSTRLIHSAQVD